MGGGGEHDSNKSKSISSISSGSVCQMCCDEAHTGDECPWVYSSCKISDCNGIKILSTAKNTPSKGNKYFRCQFSTCPGFQWLEEAKGEALGHVGSSSKIELAAAGCFNCGVEDHWVKDNPWRETPCPNPNCTGTGKIRTSTTDSSRGRKFLNCPKCNKFTWLSDWIKKVESTKVDEKTVRLQAALEDFCKDFIKKMQCNSLRKNALKFLLSLIFYCGRIQVGLL